MTERRGSAVRVTRASGRAWRTRLRRRVGTLTPASMTWRMPPSQPRVSPIAVRGALDLPAVAARPHSGTAFRRSRLQMEDAANDLAVFEHVVIVLTPPRWVAALEDQRRLHRLGQPLDEKVCDDKEDDCGDENIDVSPSISTERCYCLLQAFYRHRLPPMGLQLLHLSLDHVHDLRVELYREIVHVLIP